MQALSILESNFIVWGREYKKQGMWAKTERPRQIQDIFNINGKIWAPNPAVVCSVSKMRPAHPCFSVWVFLWLSRMCEHWLAAVSSWSLPIWS